MSLNFSLEMILCYVYLTPTKKDIKLSKKPSPLSTSLKWIKTKMKVGEKKINDNDDCNKSIQEGWHPKRKNRDTGRKRSLNK